VAHLAGPDGVAAGEAFDRCHVEAPPFVGLLAGGEPDPAQVELAGGVGAVAGHEQVGLDLDGVRAKSRGQGSGARAFPVAIVAGRPS
jgi:hypothetical protein